ncbi:hypothetical protein ScPMuIL_007111 [Solemya velum]
MGASYSSPDLTITVVDKCLPKYAYRPFPSHRKKEPGGLIAEFTAFPPDICRAADADANYWWTDCQFLAYNDSALYVMATPYHIRLQHTWLPVRGFPQGKICRYDIAGERFCCKPLPTFCSVYPKVQPHPDGQQFAFIGDGEVVVKCDDEELRNNYRVPRDLNFSLCKYCAISPSGHYLSVLSRVHGSYEIQVYSMDCKLSVIGTTMCHRICPEFVATPKYNEHVECMWSPDSKYLAVGSSLAVLFIMDCCQFTNICNVFADVIDDCTLSTVHAFDFNPLYGHHILSVGGTDSNIYTIDVIEGKIIQKTESHSKSMIDCIKYSPDGTTVAVAMGDFSIKLFDMHDCSPMFSIVVKDVCSTTRQPTAGAYPASIHLCFTKSGEELAVSSSDGYIRIWQLPRKLNLQYLCKMNILTLMPVNSLKKINLPKQLIHFLLDDYK